MAQTRHGRVECEERLGDEASDDALLQGALADRRVFAEFYRRYADPVYRYCNRRLGTRQVAKDATAEVIERALLFLPNYRVQPGGPFRGWLFTIVLRAVADHYRAVRPRGHRARPPIGG